MPGATAPPSATGQAASDDGALHVSAVSGQRCRTAAPRGIAADLLPMLGLAVVIVALFRDALFKGWAFIGDADRLSITLNVRITEVYAIWAHGRAPAWSEQQFMGYGLLGLHWMLACLTPVPYLLAQLPISAVLHGVLVLTVGLLVLGAASAFVCLRAYSVGPLPAMLGALTYVLSSHAIMRMAQLDLAMISLSVVPLMLLLIRVTSRRLAWACHLGLTVSMTTMILLTFLQEVAYISALLGSYSLYRSVRQRTVWPVLVFGLAFICAVIIGLPRMVTVGQELIELARTSSRFQTMAVEALRFFGDGLLGRYQEEQRGLLRGTINLHEGVQLLGSGLAALAAIACGLFSRSPASRFWGIALVVVLSVAMSTYLRAVYEAGLGRLDVPSRELRALLVNAIVIGAPAWFALGWLSRRLTRRLTRRPPSGVVNPDVRSASQDAPFFLAAVVVGLTAVLIPEVRTLLYYAFLQIDFTHARLSAALTLPLAALVTILASRFSLERPSPASLSWLAAGLAAGLALWIAREAGAAGVVAQIGPVLEVFKPRRLLTLEAVRVITSGLVLLAALVAVAWRPRAVSTVLAGGILTAWIGLETVTSADFRLNGPHTSAQAVPFEGFNFMNAPADRFRAPSPDQRAALRAHLETDQFRVVLVQNRRQFPALVEPHLAAFWDLRLVEGYSMGLPRRLNMLPWAEDMLGSHYLNIHTDHLAAGLPWRLLAALNVKYAVVVDRSFWFNPAPGGEDPPFEPARLKLLENPYPVTPRTFFTARVEPAGESPRMAGDNGARPAPRDPPIQSPAEHSVVEGLQLDRQFEVAGTIDARFAGDRVHVQLDPSAVDRFLVINELYHPSWQGWIDDAPAPVYPTNVAMRGLLVPAGASRVELRYAPFVVSPAGLTLSALGVALTGLAGGGLWLRTGRDRTRDMRVAGAIR